MTKINISFEYFQVVLTSTEFDAIAVNQSTSYPAVSLPLGTNSLPPEVCTVYAYVQKITGTVFGPVQSSCPGPALWHGH